MAERSLLDPEALARVAKMEFVARHAVEGFLTGKHPSPFHGSSVEYADHRPYTVGDEIRTIDWKLLAKTDKYYVKLYEEQTNVRATILLDMSASMAFSSPAARGQESVTKFEYGAYLAAALGYLMFRQNDSVGLTLFDSQVRHFLPGRTTASHFRRMVELLQSIRPKHDTGLGTVLHEMAGRVKRRGVVIIISDLIDNLDAITDGLAHFRYNRNEVIVFHVMDKAEIEFPYERLTRFKDMEGSGILIANPSSVRAKYLDRLDRFLRDVKRTCLERDISYQLARTDTPYEQMLKSYLHERSRMK